MLEAKTEVPEIDSRLHSASMKSLTARTKEIVVEAVRYAGPIPILASGNIFRTA